MRSLLHRCGGTSRRNSYVTPQRQKLPLRPHQHGEPHEDNGRHGWFDKDAALCTMTTALFLADVAAYTARRASAALPIALSVFRRVSSLKPIKRPPLSVHSFSSSHFRPTVPSSPASLTSERKTRGSNKSPYSQLPRISASSRGIQGKSEGWIFKCVSAESGKDEKRRRTVGKHGAKVAALDSFAFREQHRQNLISSNESLISRKLESRDLAEFAPIDRQIGRQSGRQSGRRRSEAIRFTWWSGA